LSATPSESFQRHESEMSARLEPGEIITTTTTEVQDYKNTTTTTVVVEKGISTTTTTVRPTCQPLPYFQSPMSEEFQKITNKMAQCIFDTHQAMRQLAIDAGVRNDEISDLFDHKTQICIYQHADNDWQRPGGVHLPYDTYNDTDREMTEDELLLGKYEDYMRDSGQKWANVGASIDCITEERSLKKRSYNKISNNIVQDCLV
jgi:hypothetical protein